MPQNYSTGNNADMVVKWKIRDGKSERETVFYAQKYLPNARIIYYARLEKLGENSAPRPTNCGSFGKDAGVVEWFCPPHMWVPPGGL